MIFSTINDAINYIDETVPGHELSDHEINALFNAAGIEFGDWIERDDERLDAFCAAVEQAALAHA